MVLVLQELQAYYYNKMPDLRYRGTNEPAPQGIWWSSESESEDDNSRDDPTFCPNYPSSEESGWSSNSVEVSSEKEPC